MATIVIQDLDDNAELDQDAMRQIVGGRAAIGSGLFYTKPLSLLDRNSIQGNAVLPEIGLNAGFLSGKDAL